QWSGLLGLLIVAGFLIFLIVSHQPISRRIFGFSAFSFLMTAILCIPYLTFSLRAYGLSGLHGFWASRPTGGGPMISSALQTVVAIFYMGDPSPAHNLPGSPLIGPTGGIILIIGLVVALRRWRAPNMALALIVLAVGLLPGAWSRGDVDFNR